jgi:hypothetical protein
LIGAREGFVALGANAFVQPAQYFLVYLAVPILTWILLAALLVVLWTVAYAAARLPCSLASCAGVLGFTGALSILVPWVRYILEDLTAVGFDGSLLSIFLFIAAVSIAVLTGLLIAGTVRTYDTAVSAWLPSLGIGVMVVAGLFTVPVLRFFLTDWKWGDRVGETVNDVGERPNLLLISIDTLRADHLGSYGDASGLTPNMDGLAAGGVTFRQTVSSSPWTLPAMASVVTGLHPWRHRAGLVTNRRDPLGRSPLPEGTWTLAEALRHHGFRTHAIVTNPYLALSYGLGAGFQTYESVTIESEIFVSFQSTTAFRLLTWLWPASS